MCRGTRLLPEGFRHPREKESCRDCAGSDADSLCIMKDLLGSSN
jgi:hypothetical protein